MESKPATRNTLVSRTAIPQSLRDIAHWVLWKLEKRKGKLTKTPYQIDGKLANTADASTWASFDDAAGTLEADALFPEHGYTGIGFVLTGTTLVGLDFDSIVGEDGQTEPYVLKILELLGNPYSEITPSGKGLRCFVECATLPEGQRKFSAGHYGAEIYIGNEGGRYLTITGRKFSGDGIPKLSTEQMGIAYFLVSQMRNEKFRSLWTGDLSKHGGDWSRADLALMAILSRTFKDDVVLEKVFSASKLSQREKWTGRADYRKRTIAKARKGDLKPDPEEASKSELTSCTAEQITPKKIIWLWQNRIAQKLNLLVGNPDVGKGLISYYIVACVTTGKDWYDATNILPPSEVLVLSAEEDWDDTIVPRLMAAGADLSKVHHINEEISLDRDTAALEDFLDQHPSIRLVIVDPVSSYLGEVNMTDEQRVRAILTPLKDMANRRGIAVVGVMHLNKKVELNAIHRIGGAMAFVGVARMVWLCAPKPKEDGTESDDMLMVKVKGNIVQRKLKGLSYTTKVHPVDIEGEPTMIPYVEWSGEVEQTADEITGNTSKRPAHRPAEQRQEAVAWLNEYLKDGPKLLDDIKYDGKELHDFSRCTVLRALAAMGIKPFKSGKQKGRDGKMRDHYSCKLAGLHAVAVDSKVDLEDGVEVF
jgi:putative DNA primase/helicase